MPFLIVAPSLPSVPGGFDLHAPDGFLSVGVSLLMWAITLVVLAVSVSRAGRTLDDRAVPLMGVTAAFIFAAQMFNFPIIGGTSGHLLGAVLAAILLGPWAGTLVMASVIAVQSLLFQDGGLLVMGANIFNMGIVGTIGGFAIYMTICRVLGGEQRGRMPAAAIAAWLSVMLGAGAISVELAVSGTSPLAVVLPTMLGVHAFIGLGEAAITVAALVLIRGARPDLLKLRDSRPVQAPSLEPSKG
jgi:cobalt/nickel transport system permease protein